MEVSFLDNIFVFSIPQNLFDCKISVERADGIFADDGSLFYDGLPFRYEIAKGFKTEEEAWAWVESEKEKQRG